MFIRFVIYDFDYEYDGCKKSKIILIVWNPMASPVKRRFKFSSSTGGIKNTFDITKDFNGGDYSSIDYDTVKASLK